MSGPFGSQQWMYATGEAVEGQSLRFNDDDSAYLSRTPASAGNQKTYTFSAWIKLTNPTGNFGVYFAGDTIANRDSLYFSSGYLVHGCYILYSTKFTFQSSQVFRDPSAWYHVVVAVDTTQATSTDRVKHYVNGEQITDYVSSTYPAQNLDGLVNSTNTHNIGALWDTTNNLFDGYLSEVNFIDGQALDPTSFGETNSNGLWVPKTFAGTYGTNGFYLPFNNDYTVEGFNTVTYRGNGGTQYVGGVGFEPDLVWIKERTSTSVATLNDSVRGVTQYLVPSTTAAEGTGTDTLSSFDPDGFTSGSNGAYNEINQGYVAWCWDMGTASSANTDGTISSTIRANPTYGQSIVAYLGTGADGTVGHGLSQAPELIIFKNRTSTAGYSWPVYSAEIGATKYLTLNGTAAAQTYNHFQDTDPTSSVFYLEGTSANSVNQSAANHIAYCFHSVAGYSDFGSYTGNGSTTGPVVTTGFKPAFVMVKRTDFTADWLIIDNTRSPTNYVDDYLSANSSAAEQSNIGAGNSITWLSDGFQITGNWTSINDIGGTYIYMAFADKREAAFWLDQSGNNNDWTNNNMQESDISLDSPTNNFCTLSPIDAYPISTGYISLSEGNLKCNGGPTTGYVNCASTFYQNSGKWYVEWIETSRSAASRNGVGLLTQNTNHNGYISQYDEGYFYADNGYFYYKTATGAATNYNTGTTFTLGDVIGYALDLDAGTLAMYKNNTLVYTYTGLDADTFYSFGAFGYASSDNNITNFGQDSSFAGNKVAQGNVDANGYGDFYYEPPAGYLALCTANLPEPAILDGGQNFNTVLYTGNGSTQSITGVGFQPDFLWLKGRSVAYDHGLFDVVRGADVRLRSNSTSAEYDGGGTGYMSSFDADGFSLVNNINYNNSGSTYVAWNWKADNTSGTTNTDGTITSTVSANPTAGFSIVGYTGNGTNGATVGHGLNSKPDFVLIKNRSTSATDWIIYHSAGGGDSSYFSFDASAVRTSANLWDGLTSTVLEVDAFTTMNNSGDDHIAYCFHSVEGYSKFGSYTGTGNTDGPFVYTGFKPAFIIYKRSVGGVGNWIMRDAARNPYNPRDLRLYANLTNTDAGGYEVDFLSNGFKLRDTIATMNASGSTYIYMAFAENPFKYSNAG